MCFVVVAISALAVSAAGAAWSCTRLQNSREFAQFAAHLNMPSNVCKCKETPDNWVRAINNGNDGTCGGDMNAITGTGGGGFHT